MTSNKTAATVSVIAEYRNGTRHVRTFSATGVGYERAKRTAIKEAQRFVDLCIRGRNKAYIIQTKDYPTPTHAEICRSISKKYNLDLKNPKDQIRLEKFLALRNASSN